MLPTTRVRDAYERLYSERWTETTQLARTILRGYSDPADVAATAYTRLWAEVTSGRAEHLHERLMELVETIAATELTRARREEKYLGRVGEDEESTLIRDGGTHATGLTELHSVPFIPTQERHHFAVEFDAAVRSLTPKQREAFVLTDLRGLSTVEAASVLGITRQSLSERRSRALASITESLIEEGVR